MKALAAERCGRLVPGSHPEHEGQSEAPAHRGGHPWQQQRTDLKSARSGRTVVSARSYRALIHLSMSDVFTRNSQRVRRRSTNAFQNNTLNVRLPSRHGSCIGTPHKPASCFRKGSSPHHGLDLVDSRGIPGRWLRRHAARRVGRPRAKGEGAGLVAFAGKFRRASGLRKRAAWIRSAFTGAQPDRLRMTDVALETVG